MRRSGVREHVEAGTFHAVALGLLRQRWVDLDRRPPTVLGDRDRLLAEIAAGIPITTLGAEADWSAARGVPASGYVAAARASARRGATAPDRIAAALGAYAELKHRRGVVDFDDILAMCASELDRDPAWAAAVRFRFRHLLVDEAQDLNPVQRRLFELLDGGRGDLFLVGDPAQAIYGFNGADPEILADVAARFPGIEVIGLPVNHRCSPQIVAAGCAVLRAGGQERAASSARADGPAVRVLAADDEDHEAALVAATVRSFDPTDVRAGAVAVLARTNSQLPRLARAIEAAGMPVHRDHLAAGSPLGAAVRAATALPSASRLRAWAHDVLDSGPDGDGDGEAGPAEAAERRVAVAVLDFLRDQPFGDGAALRTWLATANPFAAAAAGGVELLTFHAAKGREWPNVVLAGVETGLVPHRSATTNAAREEEARLLHVAVTRPADRLVLTWAARRGGYQRRPSPLLDGIETGDVAAAPPPPELLADAPRRDPVLDALHAWRDRAALAAGILPEEMCRDADLAAIAATRPTTAAELAAVTTLGALTAARLWPSLHTALPGDCPPTCPATCRRPRDVPGRVAARQSRALAA